MALVLIYSFMPRGSFSIPGSPSLENYVDIVEQDFYISFAWSLFLAFISVVILLVVCYPLAVALRRIKGRRAHLLTLLIVAPLFVAENIRLQGWVLFFDKGGFLDGALKVVTGLETGEPGQQRARDRLRHLLHLPALHAVPDPAGARQRTQGGARGGLRPGRIALAGFSGTSSCRWRCRES